MRQEYTGRSTYVSSLEVGSWNLHVAIRCFVEHLSNPVDAFLDTGAEWCVLPPALAVELGLELNPEENRIALSTRFGFLKGRLERVGIRLHADEGEPLDVEATCFVSEDWPGPMVLGWKGFLDRFRFAFDPTTESFYFAEL